MDHFSRLGVRRGPSLDLDALERQYLARSKSVHPDLRRSPEEQEAMLEASASLNEAYRVLTDPWQRFAYLAELYCPGVTEQTKELGQDFLLAAMELGEEVEAARADPASRARKAVEIRATLDGLATRIQGLLEAPSGARDAATLCHRARYYRRALEILEQA